MRLRKKEKKSSLVSGMYAAAPRSVASSRQTLYFSMGQSGKPATPMPMPNIDRWWLTGGSLYFSMYPRMMRLPCEWGQVRVKIIKLLQQCWPLYRAQWCVENPWIVAFQRYLSSKISKSYDSPFQKYYLIRTCAYLWIANRVEAAGRHLRIRGENFNMEILRLITFEQMRAYESVEKRVSRSHISILVHLLVLSRGKNKTLKNLKRSLAWTIWESFLTISAK